MQGMGKMLSFLLPFLKYLFMFVCVTFACGYHWEPEEAIGALEAGVAVVAWVLGTELALSVRADRILTPAGSELLCSFRAELSVDVC